MTFDLGSSISSVSVFGIQIRYLARRRFDVHFSEVKIGGQEQDWPVLKAGLENERANVVAAERGEIGSAVPRRELICRAGAVRHSDGRLRELNVEPHAQNDRAVGRQANEAGEVDV